mmetsp:Transcript_8098/g.16970  ORF Transcript_8098/g.16970 Transcript_8098/m.16970 type:complete len:121 (-) Transcript_8098:255-617(-)
MRSGLKIIPDKLENAELKIDAASSPPALFVRTMTVFIACGRQEQITNPSAKLCGMSSAVTIRREAMYTNIDTTKKLYVWTKRLKRIRLIDFENSSVLIPSPETKKMMSTATHDAVIFGFK